MLPAQKSPRVRSNRIISKALWKAIEPLIPNLRENQYSLMGRRPLPHREAISGILLVLRERIAWDKIPLELGWGTGMTCWRRLRAFQEIGVWPAIVEILKRDLPDGQSIPFARVAEFIPRASRKPNKPKQVIAKTGSQMNGKVARKISAGSTSKAGLAFSDNRKTANPKIVQADAAQSPAIKPVAPRKPAIKPVAPRKPVIQPIAASKPVIQPEAARKPAIKPVAASKLANQPTAASKLANQPTAASKLAIKPLKVMGRKGSGANPVSSGVEIPSIASNPPIGPTPV